ncbi:hypothetical protein AB4Y43_16655 [Paraburkholderia sp. BR10872]|uniref:hypothetical protein n=1 Tax=Paraburkholderia sp. BR10872 TaxID=3236989 RepID=UPI0034D2812E
MSGENRSTPPAGGEQSERARPALRIVKTVALNMIPGYPLYGAIRSFKRSTEPGAAVISDLAKRLPHKRARRRARSWNQVMEARRESRNRAVEAGAAKALPQRLSVIRRRSLQAKWVFLALAFFALCRALGYATSAQWTGVVTSAFFGMVCSLQIFKFEYRLRQMETGPKNPDKPLMSAREFLRDRGFVKHFFNPRIEWK